MNIKAENLGYKELCKIADFIYAISIGNPAFWKLIEESDDVEITYNYNYCSVEIKEKNNVLFPGDFDIFEEKQMMPRPDEIRQLMNLIQNLALGRFDLTELAREGQIPERFWDELGIKRKTYKLIETEVECTKYATLKFMVPEDLSDSQVIEFIQTTVDDFAEDVDEYAGQNEWIVSRNKTNTLKKDILEDDAGIIANRNECFNADSYDTDF